MIDIQGIKEALPHRYPMLLVDRVLEVSEDTIVAIKNVTINEPFFNGHFPQYPVMPGVLIMEALAQTAGVLELSKPENKGQLVFYAGMDKAWSKKFHTLFQILLVLVATMQFLLSNVGRISKYEFKRY